MIEFIAAYLLYGLFEALLVYINTKNLIETILTIYFWPVLYYLLIKKTLNKDK